MKKLVFCTVLLMTFLVITGCTRKEIFITADEVSVNTILAKPNGVLQVATVEDFDKTYYKLGELEEFVAKEIDIYNQAAGAEKIKINDVVLREGKAIMVLTYSGMEPYATFNEVTAAYFNGGVSDIPLSLPATLINTKNASYASTEEVLANTKWKVLVMTEPYDILVDGDIKYYSENAKLVEDNKVQGASEGLTVVVYKP